jgi:hypothetical protein
MSFHVLIAATRLMTQINALLETHKTTFCNAYRVNTPIEKQGEIEPQHSPFYETHQNAYCLHCAKKEAKNHKNSRVSQTKNNNDSQICHTCNVPIAFNPSFFWANGIMKSVDEYNTLLKTTPNTLYALSVILQRLIDHGDVPKFGTKGTPPNFGTYLAFLTTYVEDYKIAMGNTDPDHKVVPSLSYSSIDR